MQSAATKQAIEVYRELGALAFLIICGALALGYLIWRIVKIQDKISDTQERIEKRLEGHDQRAQDMHGTCRVHGEQISHLHKGMNEFKADVKEEINLLSREIAVLKERID